MYRNRCNNEVRPFIVEVPIGKEVRLWSAALDAWADRYIAARPTSDWQPHCGGRVCGGV